MCKPPSLSRGTVRNVSASGRGYGMPLRTYTVAGRRLAVRRTGTPGGPPVLLLHGLGSDHRGLSDLAAAWPRADVYSPDLPGFGHSATMPAPHSLSNYAVVLDVLRERIG